MYTQGENYIITGKPLTKDPWFAHEENLPVRTLFRHPEALAITTTKSISRPIVEGLIMIRISFSIV
jgi:hypothetical protein